MWHHEFDTPFLDGRLWLMLNTNVFAVRLCSSTVKLLHPQLKCSELECNNKTSLSKGGYIILLENCFSGFGVLQQLWHQGWYMCWPLKTPDTWVSPHEIIGCACLCIKMDGTDKLGILLFYWLVLQMGYVGGHMLDYVLFQNRYSILHFIYWPLCYIWSLPDQIRLAAS